MGYPATRRLEGMVREFLRKLFYIRSFLEVSMKEDQAADVQTQIDLHGPTSYYDARLEGIKGELKALEKRLAEDQQAEPLLKQKRVLAKRIDDEVKKQRIRLTHVLTLSAAHEGRLVALASSTENAYLKLDSQNKKDPLNHDRRDKMLDAFDRSKSAKKILVRTKSRVQALRAEKAWVNTLESRVKQARRPPAPQVQERDQHEQQLGDLHEDEEEEEEGTKREVQRSLGVRGGMGLRAAKRYWGVQY